MTSELDPSRGPFLVDTSAESWLERYLPKGIKHRLVAGHTHPAAVCSRLRRPKMVPLGSAPLPVWSVLMAIRTGLKMLRS